MVAFLKTVKVCPDSMRCFRRLLVTSFWEMLRHLHRPISYFDSEFDDRAVIIRPNEGFYSLQIVLVFLNISIRSLTMPMAPACGKARVIDTVNTIKPTMTRSFCIFMLLKTLKTRFRGQVLWTTNLTLNEKSLELYMSSEQMRRVSC